MSREKGMGIIMKKVAVIICNYNKKEYVIKCIDAILCSSIKDLDIYVVDNASEDGSSEEIKRKFKAQVHLVENKENLGGAGGFNTGMKVAMEKKYEYMFLADNDMIPAADAIENLYQFMQQHEEIGILGSKIYSMDNPELIQELGAVIDFNSFGIKPFYKNYIDDENVPEIVCCDFVPACAMMVRVSALKEVGLMNEENFIYWDDIEWGYRFKEKGYEVAAFSGAKVWHKMGASAKVNTFATYYFWRNRIKFFMKYTNGKKREQFAEVILEELFQALYACNYQKKYNTMKTLMYAFDDAVHGNLGKATEEKILPSDCTTDRFAALINGKEHVYIKFNGDYRVLRILINKLTMIASGIEITIIYQKESSLNTQFPDIKVREDISFILENEIVFTMCEHIFKVEPADECSIYIDEYLNLIQTEEDLAYCLCYQRNKQLFIKCHKQFLSSVDSAKQVG